ncbi:hypothetical protein JCM16408A_25740 [Methylobacterium phyllosphaerae]
MIVSGSDLTAAARAAACARAAGAGPTALTARQASAAAEAARNMDLTGSSLSRNGARARAPVAGVRLGCATGESGAGLRRFAKPMAQASRRREGAN